MIYAQDWVNQALSSDRIMATFGSNYTSAMTYNLFASRLLGATIIPEQVREFDLPDPRNLFLLQISRFMKPKHHGMPKQFLAVRRLRLYSKLVCCLCFKFNPGKQLIRKF
jgi:hypothetical protein